MGLTVVPWAALSRPGVHWSPLGSGPVGCRWNRHFRPGVHESSDTPPPSEKTLGCLPQDRAQAAGGPFGKDRNVVYHHARHPASGRVEHLLWAMAGANA